MFSKREKSILLLQFQRLQISFRKWPPKQFPAWGRRPYSSEDHANLCATETVRCDRGIRTGPQLVGAV